RAGQPRPDLLRCSGDSGWLRAGIELEGRPVERFFEHAVGLEEGKLGCAQSEGCSRHAIVRFHVMAVTVLAMALASSTFFRASAACLSKLSAISGLPICEYVMAKLLSHFHTEIQSPRSRAMFTTF